MVNPIYTIGFTQKTAEKFFTLIKDAGITLVVDVRLNNVSQLAGFSKYPDVEYFLREICNCKYVSDKKFSPSEKTLKDYKGKLIDWNEYVVRFDETMRARNVEDHIVKRYSAMVENERICLLCSENSPEFCHRRLVAERFAAVCGCEIMHLM